MGDRRRSIQRPSNTSWVGASSGERRDSPPGVVREIQAICAQAGLPAELAGLACWFELLRGCRAPARELVALAGGGAPMAEVEERGEHDPEPVHPTRPRPGVYSSTYIKVAKGRKMMPSSGSRKVSKAASILAGRAIHRMNSARRGNSPANSANRQPISSS
jgi:hypothetical protein